MRTLIRGAAVLAAGAILYASPALATEGYFSHGYGAVNKSMAGAGVATGFDPMSAATNPAALANIAPGFTADLSIFSPHRSYSVTSSEDPCDICMFPLWDGNYDSDRDYFFIPSLAGSYNINDSSSYGWAFYGNGGMNTTWTGQGAGAPAPGPFYGGKTGVDYAQAFLQLTYDRRFESGFSVGVSPIFVAQRFKAFGVGAFMGFSSAPTKLTDNGYDWSYGYGAKIGGQVDIGAGFRFGASYQTRMYMTEFDKYAGLFAEQGDMDVPSAFQAGFSWDSASGGVTVALDYKRINYEDIKAVSNPFMPNIMGPGQLGDNNGAGFGWENINIYKLGAQFEVTPTIKLRAGVAINDQPIPETEVMFNILAPGVMEQHYTTGLTWQVTPNSAVNFAFMYAPSVSVTGPNPLFNSQTITIEMWQWESTVGWTWTF